MFPAPSPNTQAMFAQLAGSGATPGTLDFHRTAMTAAAANKQNGNVQPQAVTSQPQEIANGTAAAKAETKPPTGPFDPHDNDAANGLFMLAQGRNSAQAPNPPYTIPPQQQAVVHPTDAIPSVAQTNGGSPQLNGNASVTGSSARGVSEAASAGSEESEQARPSTRGKGKRTSTATATTNGRRKADDAPAKAPANKKAKTNGATTNGVNGDMDHSDDDTRRDDNGSKSKMTDEEKRKNFLERNRYVARHDAGPCCGGQSS